MSTRTVSVVLIALGIYSLFALEVHGQKDKTYPMPTHFIKAEVFRQLPEADRLSYTTGLMDGFLGAALFGGNNTAITKLNECTNSMDSPQIDAIIMKYVKDHPENWQYPLSLSAFNALNAACPGGINYLSK